MECLPPPQNSAMGEGGRLELARAARAEAKATTKTETVTELLFTLLLPARRRVGLHPRNRKKGATPSLPTLRAYQGAFCDAAPRSGRHFFSGATQFLSGRRSPPLLGDLRFASRDVVGRPGCGH